MPLDQIGAGAFAGADCFEKRSRMSNAHILRLIVTRTNVLISASNQNISRRRDAIDATASLCDCVCSMAWMF